MSVPISSCVSYGSAVSSAIFRMVAATTETKRSSARSESEAESLEMQLDIAGTVFRSACLLLAFRRFGSVFLLAIPELLPSSPAL